LRRAASWSRTTGRILRSRLETRRHRFEGDSEKIENVPLVEYEFTAGGRTVRGTRIGIGDHSGGEDSEAALARQSPVAMVTVYYDPDDPRNCVLERGGPQGITTKGCLAALAAFAIVDAIIWWLVAYGPDFVRAHFPNATAHPGFIVGLAGVGLALLLIG